MGNFISLSQAAKQFKISKGTISNAIKNGALATKGKSSNGGYKIDIADFEVWRTNNYKNPRKTRFVEPDQTPSMNTIEPLKNSLLQTKLDVMIEQRDFYKNQFDKVETEKNRFVDMLEKKDNLLTFYQEKEVEQKPVAVKKSYWGRGFIAASLIAILAIGGTITILSPEKLAFLKTNESQAVAAIPKTTPMINIEPAAGAPQDAVQSSLSSSQENVR